MKALIENSGAMAGACKALRLLRSAPNVTLLLVESDLTCLLTTPPMLGGPAE
jgi:hypothetical protein